MTADVEQRRPEVLNEERRQRSVDSLGLVRGRSEERLDRIARVARTLFDVERSTVTVLDGDIALFPGAAGPGGLECARSETLCHHATAERALLVVEDARVDDRFSGLEAVVGGQVRFYAGAPLADTLGNVVGVFCIMDPEPRRLSEEHLDAFRDLAVWAQQELVASAEMSAAGRVQASMLPTAPLRLEGWDVGGLCIPALSVGGDFFDYGVRGEVAHLVLGDVMGKGTGAALVGAGVRSAVRGTVPAIAQGVDLGICATQVARALTPDLERSESFVTLFEVAIELEDGWTRWVDAGMGLALVARTDGQVLRLAGDDRPFGILPEDHWTEHQLTLAPGERLLLFSDGLLDLVDDPDQWWVEIGLMLQRADDVAGLLARVRELVQERIPLDDVTVVGAFRAPAGSVR